MRNDAHLEEFYGIIEDSGIFDGYRWERVDSERYSSCRLPPHEIKKCSRCVRLVRKAIDLDHYHTRFFPFINVMDEVSQSWRKPLEERAIKPVLGFGSYQNPCKNTFSHIHCTDKVIEFIEVNNHWQPEYYVVYERRPREMFDRTAALLGQLRALGKVPEGVKLHTLNKTRMMENDSIYRRPRLVVGLGLSWEGEDPRIHAFIDKLKHRFPNHRELVDSLQIGE